jgi:uncharacterized protein
MKTTILFIIFSSIFLIINPLLFAASFDCSKAATKIETTICGDTNLNKLDSEMADIYKKFKTTATIEQWDMIKASQVAWLKMRNVICSKGTTECLSDIIKKRIGELSAIKIQPPSINSASLSTKSASKFDFYSGAYTFKIASDYTGLFLCKYIQSNKSLFYLTIARGECSGNVEDTLVFTDSIHAKLNLFTPDDTCQLLFIFSNNSINISEVNCLNSHGMRCRLGGSFLKTSSVNLLGGTGLNKYLSIVNKIELNQQANFLAKFNELTEYYSKEKVSVIDIPTFLVDFDSYGSKSVQMEGYILTMGEIAILYERPGSLNYIYLDITNLSSDEKKRMIRNCGSGCPMTVVGLPGLSLFYGKVLQVTSIVN